MSTFMLVHGAWHGAWCWERLVPELYSLGHRTLAVDLPSADPAATFETYADQVVEAMSSEDDEVILVGHSMAGMTIPLVAARRPVRHLVFLCALVPVPGSSLVEQLGESDVLLPEYASGLEEDEHGNGRWIDADLARQVLYADCDENAAERAIKRLRPQARTPYAVPCQLDELPAVPRTYVACSEDRLVNPDWSRRVATGRLGAELVELQSSHSPFLSRPREVAEILHRAAS
jgi:pimeloyl-ACP methyl ester carboxylesterase